MKKLVAFLAFALLLSAMLPMRAQRFSVTVDTVALNIVGKGPSYSSIHIRNAVKYHDYYYLALHCIDDQRGFDTIVVVSADGKNVTFAGKLILDWEYNKSILWQGTFFVNHDTLYRIENVNTDNPSGYYFDEKSWSWKYLSYVDKAVFIWRPETGVCKWNLIIADILSIIILTELSGWVTPIISSIDVALIQSM